MLKKFLREQSLSGCFFASCCSGLYNVQEPTMLQVSEKVYCDDFIAGLRLETRLMPNPYYEYPYLYIEGFLPGALCREITEYVQKKSDAQNAEVKATRLKSIVEPKVDDSIRKTQIHKLPEPYLSEYEVCFRGHQKRVEEYFSIALTRGSTVQALEYTQGSFYIKHADDSNELLDDEGRTAGFVQVAPFRKLTTVVFTTSCSESVEDNHHFSGGELRFNYLFDADGKSITMRPKAGDMIVFPSNPIYSHEVLKVKTGYRLTLVQWHNGLIG